MKKFSSLGPFLIFFILLSGLLEFLVKSNSLAAYLVPAPSQVLKTLYSEQNLLRKATAESALIASLGLGLSVLVGGFLGALLALLPFFRRLFFPLAIFFQTVPIIAIAPLLVIWFGYGRSPVILSSFIVSVFPILSSVVSGIRSTPRDYLTLASLYQGSLWRRLFFLQIPCSLPFFAAALKSSAGLALVGAVVGEFMNGAGLGGVIEVARVQYRVDLVFAAIFCLLFLGLVAFLVTSLLENKIRKRFTEA